MHESEDVIPNAEFESKCERIRSGSAPTLVAACRMEPLKGVDFIVRAVGLLRERGIFVRARLYGNGRDLDRLKLLLLGVTVTDAVSFPGTLTPGRELQDALRRGDIFLMPHLTSDFGRAFFDALAAGTPVVAFRSVASQDTVRHGVDGAHHSPCRLRRPRRRRGTIPCRSRESGSLFNFGAESRPGKHQEPLAPDSRRDNSKPFRYRVCTGSKWGGAFGVAEVGLNPHPISRHSSQATY